MSIVVKNLHVQVEEKDILHGIDLTIKKGEVHVLMGPNGSGKSTFANTLAGHPSYKVKEGSIIIDNEEVTNAPADERAKKGLFLSMQHTPAIAGVSIGNFLRVTYNALHGEKVNPLAFHRVVKEKAELVGLDESYLSRHVNVGLSGGEKKKFELLQLLVLQPTYIVLDETDAGLDRDALQVIREGISKLANKDVGLLIITHYPTILEELHPTAVHIMKSGSLVATGGKELIQQVEEEGYQSFQT